MSAARPGTRDQTCATQSTPVRRRTVAYGPGAHLHFQAQTARPEDIILSKMMAHRSGGMEKHILDILSILEISGDVLDQDYLAHWITQLKLDSVWQAIQERRIP